MRAFLIAAALLATTPLGAVELKESCELETPKDGFVALRDGPSANAKLLVKMDPKGAVIPRVDQRDWRRGNWMRVSYWRPGIEFDEAVAKGPVGWMNSKLSAGCG